ncbi:MAG TPA: hypothetical protein VG897_16125 [Terriglobales bacterium]|nr:hypothetical protein [Terriglobales bacterium]
MERYIVDMGSASKKTHGFVTSGNPQNAETSLGVQRGKPALCDIPTDA